MKIMELLRARQANARGAQPVTIAFLGDSVTHGCFELYTHEATGRVLPVYEQQSAYHARLKKMLGRIYPAAAVNVINAGVSGDSSGQGLARLERDVLRFDPDLVVVCFGLNDCNRGTEFVDEYVQNMSAIFDAVQAHGAECIFLTPNMIGTRVAEHIHDPLLRATAERACTADHVRALELCVQGAKAAAAARQIPVCDCYAVWQAMAAAGADTTALLCNDINHPCREMHDVFAYELLKTMLMN